jgi:two-component system chemotaxis response regulator CheB
MSFELICIGASWGGVNALGQMLDELSDDIDQAIVIAQHRGPTRIDGGLAGVLQHHSRRLVSDPDDKETIQPNHVYLAPPDYHLLVEPGSLALSTDARVNFARPSIDVLFESAADAYGDRAIGVILTGANDDGARGLARIKERGGVAIVQDPEDSVRRAMPDAAIAATIADAVLPLEAIPDFLYGLCRRVAQ